MSRVFSFLLIAMGLVFSATEAKSQDIQLGAGYAIANDGIKVSAISLHFNVTQAGVTIPYDFVSSSEVDGFYGDLFYDPTKVSGIIPGTIALVSSSISIHNATGSAYSGSFNYGLVSGLSTIVSYSLNPGETKSFSLNNITAAIQSIISSRAGILNPQILLPVLTD